MTEQRSNSVAVTRGSSACGDGTRQNDSCHEVTTKLQSAPDEGLSDDVIMLFGVVAGFVCLLLMAVVLTVGHRFICDKCRSWRRACVDCRVLRRGRTCDIDHRLFCGNGAETAWHDGILWTAGPPIVNGNFIPHTPVMFTPPTYDDLVARDAAVAKAQNRQSQQAPSPPPSYCSRNMPQDADTPQSCDVPVSVSLSQPAVSVDTTVPVTASSQLPAARVTTPDPRTVQFPGSFQSLENIDLAIFGSVSALTDTSPAGTGSSERTQGGGETPRRLDNISDGVVLDAAAVFTGPRHAARLVTPHFLPRTQRGHVFDPTALLRVDEASIMTEACRDSVLE